MKKTIVLLLCVLIALSLVGCQPAAAPEVSETPAPTAAAGPTAEPTAEPTPAPEEPGAVPTPAPEGEETGSEGHVSMLPMPESADKAFVAAFMENPIDQRYGEDMELATSLVEITDVNNAAAESWKNQIDAAYIHILETADEDTVNRVKAEQEAWLDAQNARLQEIRDNADEDSAVAAVNVSENIMLYYRSRAIDLCAVMYALEEQLVFG